MLTILLCFHLFIYCVHAADLDGQGVVSLLYTNLSSIWNKNHLLLMSVIRSFFIYLKIPHLPCQPRQHRHNEGDEPGPFPHAWLLRELMWLTQEQVTS